MVLSVTAPDPLDYLCGCLAHSRPHNHSWTGTDPVERTDCDHDWRLTSCLISEPYLRCVECGETSEYWPDP